MSQIKFKTTHVPSHLTVNAAAITSNCNSISFENYGSINAKIYINGSADYNYLVAGMTKVYGDNPNSLVQDSFAIVFDAGVGAGINISKESINVIE
jgi:hypothetical protein